MKVYIIVILIIINTSQVFSQNNYCKGDSIIAQYPVRYFGNRQSISDVIVPLPIFVFFKLKGSSKLIVVSKNYFAIKNKRNNKVLELIKKDEILSKMIDNHTHRTSIEFVLAGPNTNTVFFSISNDDFDLLKGLL